MNPEESQPVRTYWPREVWGPVWGWGKTLCEPGVREKVGRANMCVNAQPERVRASWSLPCPSTGGCRGQQSRVSPASRIPWEWNAKHPGMVTVQESLQYSMKTDSELVLRRKDEKYP